MASLPVLGLVLPAPSDLVPLVVPAAGVVLVVRALLLASRRSVAGKGHDTVVVFAVAAGFLLALWQAKVRPAFPLAQSDSEWQWVFWFAPAAAVLGALASTIPSSSRGVAVVRALVRFAIGALAAWLVASKIDPHWIDEPGRWRRVAAGGLGIAVVWTLLALDTGPARRAALAGSAVVAAGVGAIAYVNVGHGAVLGQALGAFATALAVAVLPFPLRDGPRLSVALAPMVALVVAFMAVYGFCFLNYGENVKFPLSTAILLGVAPAVGSMVPTFGKPWLATLLGAAAALAAVVAAAILGGVLEEPAAW